jgi:hypothetical protein
MRMPENKLFRTFIYFLVVGGLLLLSSLVIMYVWNNLIIKFDFHEITYLESMGINAVLYVFVYSISYGFFGAHSELNFNFGNNPEAYISKMTAEEKDELRKTIRKTLVQGDES